MSDDDQFIGQCEREYPEHNATIELTLEFNPVGNYINITARGECGFLGTEKFVHATIGEDSTFEEKMSQIEDAIFDALERVRLMKSKLSAWAGEEPEFEDAYGKQSNVDIDTMGDE